jgi:hypothetical protein
MGHAAWSPKTVPIPKRKLTNACIRAVEDARVNRGLKHINIPVVFPRSHSERFQNTFSELSDNDAKTELLIRAIAGMGTNLERRYAKVLRAAHAANPNGWVVWVATILNQVDAKMNRARSYNHDGAVFTFEQGVRIARFVAKKLKDEDEDNSADQRASGTMTSLDNAIEKAVQVPKQEMDAQLKREYEAKKSWQGMNLQHKGGVQPFDPKMAKFYGHEWGSTEPGEMFISTPKLNVNVMPPKLEKLRRHSVSDEGTEFRHIERFVTDQKVFRRKRKKREGGGSVLVDCSGSMSLCDDDIEKIIAGAPEATLIAVYSGDGRKGEVRIVVANGKRTMDVSPFGYANCVDIPALEWLACQPEPRAWLSDGYVTGIDDRRSHRLNQAAGTICRDNGIKRCPGVKAVVEVLRRVDHLKDEDKKIPSL